MKILLLVSVISVMINIMIILPYINLYSAKIRDKLFLTEYFSTNDPDSIMLDKVLETTCNIGSTKMPLNDPRGLFKDLKSFYGPSRHQSINNYYTSYALVGASYYAMYINDSTTMKCIKKKMDNYIDIENSALNYSINTVDQTPIGIVFLNLYKYYRKDIYINIAKGIFNDIVSMQKKGVIYYRSNTDRQLSDVLGMYVPFFMEYFDLTKDSLAYHIVDYNMEEFYKYGVNKETGIPCHGYNINTNIPVGSANWGRGIGWYLLAAAYCPQFKDNSLDSILKNIEYTQYPGSSQQFDSSTALMFEIYKQSKDKYRRLNLSFIKSHVLKNGFVDDCSGDTYNLNDYSHTFGESELCNGFLLMLSSKFRN